MNSNQKLQLAYDYVCYTDKTIFLTGKAGTGKTTFLRNLKKNLPKRMVVVAPTGVAAINAGGVTIHSFFQMSFGPQVPANVSQYSNHSKDVINPNAAAKKINREKISLIKSIDLLVIDEISMVRADMLDAIDEVLRKYRNWSKPFGGVQLLMIGDLHQLSPVVKENEWEILKDYYDTVYFFSSKALQKANPVCIELSHIYRQSDKKFIDLLGKIRNRNIDDATLEELNKRYSPDTEIKDEDGYIVLTTHNQTAQEINIKKLKKNNNRSHFFDAHIEGDFPEYIFPTEPVLELKTGAQVMFVKNDSSKDKLYYNGKIGKITKIEDGSVFVKCFSDFAEIEIHIEEWRNVKYSLDPATKEIKENIIGTFTQFPLKLAWAITIHKSQGLTFDKAIIDAHASFAHGQVYVALSRCRSLEGIVLKSPITMDSIKTDSTVSRFSEINRNNQPDDQQLKMSKLEYQQSLIDDLFNFKIIEYALSNLIKVVNDNSEVIDKSVKSDADMLLQSFHNDIISVSQKFNLQLQQLYKNDIFPEDNFQLQERIMKASSYFAEKTENILYKYTLDYYSDCDNKDIRKAIEEALIRLQKEAFVKIACMKACKNGFNTLSFLKTKSGAEIDYKVQIKTKVSGEAFSPKNIEHSELYVCIRHWRNQIANDNDLPVYMILPQKSMYDIANSLPVSMQELKKVKGIGKKKLLLYGDKILSMVLDYCNQKNIDKTHILNNTGQDSEKVEKVNSKEKSFQMFKSGMSVPEIATERKFAESTIHGHLALYVAKGDLDVYDFVSKDKVNIILNFLKENKSYNLGMVKLNIQADVAYTDIKYVMSHLIAKGGF